MPSLEDNTTQVGSHTDNRHIIPVKSQGFFQSPQDIIEEYNGYSDMPCKHKFRSEEVCLFIVLLIIDRHLFGECCFLDPFYYCEYPQHIAFRHHFDNR